jgi:hypothetical protein
MNLQNPDELQDFLLDNEDLRINDQGFLLLESGAKEQGIQLIQKAAENGQPNALATLIWTNVIDDDIKLAIDNFEKCFPKTDEWLAKEEQRIKDKLLALGLEVSKWINEYSFQIYNSKSNAALAYFADGQDLVAMKYWEQVVRVHNNAEARFFSLFFTKKDDLDSLMPLLNNRFTKDELNSLILEFTEVASSGKGWFAQLAKEALIVLEKPAKEEFDWLGELFN